MTQYRGACLLWISCGFLAIASAQEIFLGSFITKAHQVSGDVYLLSEKVLEIRDYTYDGQGPAAFFWADTAAQPTNGGRVISDGSPGMGCAMTIDDQQLPRADGITQRVEFPEGVTINDYLGGSLSVWCEAFAANFGHLTLPSSLDEIPSPGPELECVEQVPPIAQTPDGYNCENLLENKYQVRWKVDGDDIHVELVGFIDDSMYMGFGISGRPQKETWMIGADVVVVDMTESGPRAQDIFMDQRAQCSGEAGVCRDTDIDFTNGVKDISGEQDFGLTMIRYTRPLIPADIGQVTSSNAAVDMSIPVTPGVDTYIVWALGPISDNGNALFHSGGYAKQDGESVSLDFGRSPQDNCPPLVTIGSSLAPTPTPPLPFSRPLIGDSDGSIVFDCHIGPSGGPRGYTSITGKPSWGIAWYINGYLIPKLILRRGTTYTFRVNGGFDKNDDANYHPFYLTTSPEGGYFQLTPEERLNEKPLAGITVTESDATGVTGFESTGVAPICRYETAGESAEAELGPYENYFQTLDTSCASNQLLMDEAAILTFTPDDTTPDTIYYHCVTHKNLGFEIEVIAADGPTVTKSPTGAPVKEPELDGFTPVELVGQLEGSTLRYKANVQDKAANGQDTLSVILTVPAVGWVSFGISETGLMVGSEAVIGLPDTGEVKKYNLNAQNNAGVVPMPDEKQTLIDASVRQTSTTTTLSFTKILNEPGEIPINRIGIGNFLSAYGSSNTLGFHSARQPYSLDFASRGVGTLDVKMQSLWKAHGWLAGIAWTVLSPLAIGASLLRKFIPGDALWFQIHRTFNILVVVCTFIAVGLAVPAIQQETPSGSDPNHFDPSLADGHRTIGLVVYIFAGIQAIGGLLHPHLPKKLEADAEVGEEQAPPEKSAIRKAWEIGHRVLGFGLLGLCWYQVSLGIHVYSKMFNSGNDETAMRVFLSVIGIIGGVIFVGFIASKFTNSKTS